MIIKAKTAPNDNYCNAIPNEHLSLAIRNVSIKGQFIGRTWLLTIYKRIEFNSNSNYHFESSSIINGFSWPYFLFDYVMYYVTIVLKHKSRHEW